MGLLSNHPNIVTVYSAGVTQRGWAYFVMEYVSRGSSPTGS
jgi:serine/threonine protein kinase